MSDLDKLMKKLKDDKETPQETGEVKPAKVEDVVDEVVEAVVEEDQEAVEDELDEDLVEDVPAPTETVTNVDTDGKDIPVEDQNPAHTVEAEVGILQNNGVYRRELLATLKELVDVQKVNAQVMIEIKKAVTGDKDAK